MKFLGKATAACVFAMSAPAVSAASFGFDILNNSGLAQDGVDQFSVDVTDRGATNEVVFTFLNEGPKPATMTRLFWDDNAGVLGDFVERFTTTPVPTPSGYAIGFKEKSGGTLPGGNAVGFDFDFQLENDGSKSNGIDPGENLSVVFQRNGSFQSVLDALGASFTDSSGLRIGVHAQSFADGESNSFISTTPPGGGTPVPSPTAALTGMVMFGGLVMRRRRRD